MRIDFVSDLTCPWCAIGLRTLERAIVRVAASMPVTLHLQPFELNPGLPTEGEAIAAYAARKYGVSAAELAERQTLIRRRARELGMRTMREDGIRKVLAGLTTADEVIHVTMGDAN